MFFADGKPIELDMAKMDNQGGVIQTLIDEVTFPEMKLGPEISFRCVRYEVVDDVGYMYKIDPFSDEQYTHIVVNLKWDRSQGTRPLDSEKLKNLQSCQIDDYKEMTTESGESGEQGFSVKIDSAAAMSVAEYYRECMRDMILNGAKYFDDLQQNGEE